MTIFHEKNTLYVKKEVYDKIYSAKHNRIITIKLTEVTFIRRKNEDETYDLEIIIDSDSFDEANGTVRESIFRQEWPRYR